MDKQVTHSASIFEVDNTFEDDRFMRVRVAAMHSGINRNKSRFSTDCIKAAKDTFANIPVLASVHEYTDDEGNIKYDYSGHEMHIEDDAFNEDCSRMIYDEKVVGIIPETNNFEIVHDESSDRDYVYIDALLYRDYGNYCCDILESRGGKTDVSMEIACDEVSFDAKDGVLDVGVMKACGITLLGENVQPGMEGAHATTFSVDTDNVQLQLIKIMQELKESLDNYTAACSAKDKMKGGNQDLTKLEELLEKYEKTIEDITFDYSEMSDEELETAFATAFADGDEEGGEPETDEQTTEEDSVEPETEEQPEVEVELELEETEVINAINYSISYGETTTNFAVSLSDVIYALSCLVNDTYGNENSYYGVEVYDADKYIIMIDYCSGNAYKQGFKCRKDNYSLVGDRVPVKAVWCTAEEELALDEMRNNYSSISEKLVKYEEEPEKIKVLRSDDYKSIYNCDEYVELLSQDNHFDLSIDEVKAKADSILLEYAKAGNLNFANNEIHNIENKPLPAKTKSTSKYGNIFKK